MKRKKINIIVIKKGDFLSDIFHENTKLFFPDVSKDFKNETYPEIWKRIHFKSYPRFKRIFLSKDFDINRIPLERIIESRFSNREFNNKQLSFKEISKILLYSCGITKKEDEKWDESRRAYPSAGARYPLEVYVVVFNVQSITPGIYHYNVKQHSLELIRKGNFKNKIISYTNDQDWISKASMTILISAIFSRTKIKYKDRGYRYLFLDAGHMSQNFYLITTSMGLGCCSIGGFLDDEINKLIDLDGKYESIIYIIIIGGIHRR